MTDFVKNGASEIYGGATKSDSRAPTGAATEWKAGDANDIRQALLDVRTGVRYVYNVKWYGAAGNNSTNDTTAVNDAVTAASATGGVVYFPAGVYLCNVDVETSNVTIAGDGIAGRYLQVDNQGVSAEGTGSYIKPYDYTKPAIKIGDGARQINRVTVRDIGLQGDFTTGTSDGIVINGAQYCNFHNLYVCGFGRWNIWVTCPVSPTVNSVTQFNNWTNIITRYGGASGTGSCLYYDCPSSSYGPDAWVTANYFTNLQIEDNYSQRGSALYVNSQGSGLVDFFAHGGWWQVKGNGGIYLNKSTLHALNLNIEPSTSSTCMMEITPLGTDYSFPLYVSGTFRVPEYIYRFGPAGSPTYTMDWRNVAHRHEHSSYGAILARPIVHFVMEFSDNTGDPPTDLTNAINDPSGMTLSRSGNDLLLNRSGSTGNAILARRVAVPATSASTGAPGDFATDDTYFYYYGASGWRRISGSTF